MKAELEDNWLELLVTREDYEMLRSGKTAQGRWNSQDKVYLHIMDNPPDEIDKDSYEMIEWMEKSKNNREFAILNNETSEIDIFIPQWVLRNPFINATNFSLKLQNLCFEPKKYYNEAMKSYSDLHIKLNFSA